MATGLPAQNIASKWHAVADTITMTGLDPRYYYTRYMFEFCNTETGATLLVPSGGTCNLTASENSQLFNPVAGGTALVLSTAAYTRCTSNAPIVSVIAVPTGLAGATYWRMVLSQTEGV